MPDGCIRTNIAWIALSIAVILIWFATTHDEGIRAAAESSQVSPAGTITLLQFNGAGPSESPRLDFRPIISMGAAAASLFGAFLATISARRAVYNDYQKHLIELNKECIKEPFLAAVNDDARIEIETRQANDFSKWLDSGGSLKLTHFAYMQLNIFEIVYEYEMS